MDPTSAKTSIYTADQFQVAPNVLQEETEARRQCTGEPSTNCPTYILEPIVIHRYSIIILHGRGDTGASFGRGLLEDDPDENPSAPSLRQLLPGTRFIFPTAAPLPSARFQDWKLNQWFDFWSLFDVHERPELQNPGLRKNAKVVEALVEKEAEEVGIENVILGGISNGAAQAMITSMLMMASSKLHHEHQLAGLFSLCGWLPYAEDLEKYNAAKRNDNQPSDSAQQDVTQATQQSNPEASKENLALALRWLSATIADGNRSHWVVADDLEAHTHMPLFLGHGSEDNTVPVESCEDASRSLKSMEFDMHGHII